VQSSQEAVASSPSSSSSSNAMKKVIVNELKTVAEFEQAVRFLLECGFDVNAKTEVCVCVLIHD
jgi:hypothetical protein